ncbi:MAG: hypothetical protein A2V90_08950 [Gammaproteobacteria bacterium RBG_16_57_12]|nr:MAG: hypothetical protein A2V90_08950 [Gammaproteobacteria bacterium RBG_16_57_12]
MKRSTALQPLSREHHTALVLAKACERAAKSGNKGLIQTICQRAIQAFADELEPHFHIEEQSFLPLLCSAETQPLSERTRADHQQLRSLLDGLRQNNSEALDNFGKCLSVHVRFEERELFPAIECLLQEEDGDKGG